MPILNYTTGQDAAKTIAEIQAILVAHGARSVMCQYDDSGNITALSFMIHLNDTDVGIRLPSDWRPVLTVLTQQKATLHANRKTRERSYDIKATEEQARKVGWRIIKDWVEAQMAIVEFQMVKVEQVFLPYIIMKNGGTVYDEFTKNSSRLLGYSP